MTFEEILDQAIAMLQRRGRLTYGALKRQFQLDDAYLDDVKAELIEGQRVAVDEDGRVLVWTGGTDISPTITARARRWTIAAKAPSMSSAEPASTERSSARRVGAACRAAWSWRMFPRLLRGRLRALSGISCVSGHDGAKEPRHATTQRADDT